MCVAGNPPFLNNQPNIDLVGQIVNTLVKTTSNIIIKKTNYDYRTQIALSKAQAAQNEAYRQKQLGIEKSRSEKIAGLQKADKILALQGASNMDMGSYNTNLAYKDVINDADMNSKLIKNEYDTNADNYFKQANSYLNQAEEYKDQYNLSLLGLGHTGLNELNKVAQDWYNNQSKGVL